MNPSLEKYSQAELFIALIEKNRTHGEMTPLDKFLSFFPIDKKDHILKVLYNCSRADIVTDDVTCSNWVLCQIVEYNSEPMFQKLMDIKNQYELIPCIQKFYESYDAFKVVIECLNFMRFNRLKMENKWVKKNGQQETN